MSAPDPILNVGQVVGNRYEVLAALAPTPAYRPYRVFDREVEVEVALWHMRDPLFSDQARRQAFIGAVVLLRQLNHPNVRRMFDAGDADGILFATTQPDTDDGMLPQPGDGLALGEDDLIHYTTSVVAALEAAHEAGHLHGHLVPSDIVHVSGLIKVGGAGLYGDVDPTAARGCFIAAERFVAPEVLSGGVMSPASDVYSLAALLVELASGHTSDDVSETVGVLRSRNPVLADALALCLSISPERRPATPARLFDVVARALGVEPTRAEAPAPPTPPPAPVVPVPAPPHPSSSPRAPTVGTRRARPVGKRSEDFGEASDLETMVEGPWVAAANQAPPPVPSAVNGPPQATPAVPAPIDPSLPGGDSGPTLYDPNAAAVASSRGSGAVPSVVGRTTSAPIKMVSRKPTNDPERKQPQRVAAVDRPELKPVVRPISTVRPGVHNAGELGRYAPPKQPGEPASKQRGLPTWALIVAGVVLAVGVGVAVYLLLANRGSAGNAAPAAPAAPARPAPTPVVTVEQDAGGVVAPCPKAMVLVAGEHRYCIDTHEVPGEGRMPEAGLSLAHADASCRSRGKRLCTGDEWEAACRGENESSWPYGSAFLRDRCNVLGTSDDIAAAGSFPACRSAVGAFDMSGNVAEWIADGAVRGGSASDGDDGRCSRDRRAPRGDQGAADIGFRCCADARNP